MPGRQGEDPEELTQEQQRQLEEQLAAAQVSLVCPFFSITLSKWRASFVSA